MTDLITLAQVKDAAAKVVEEFGDEHLNPGVLDGNGCSYTDVDGNHCVAAQVAVSLGIPVPGLMDADNNEGLIAVDMITDHLDENATHYLVEVQSHADDGDTWAVAVSKTNASEWAVER